MTSEELRELADWLAQEGELSKQGQLDVANYLRACADAMEAGPVAWMHEDGRVIGAETMQCAERDGGAMLSSVRPYTLPLYPLAIPQPVSVADELPPDRIEAIAHRAATFYRHDEARGHEYMFKRRELMFFAARLLAEAQPSSNACQLQSFGNSEQLALRLPEPMTRAELDAVLDDYGSGAGVRHYELCRWIEAEVIKRVKEANNG